MHSLRSVHSNRVVVFTCVVYCLFCCVDVRSRCPVYIIYIQLGLPPQAFVSFVTLSSAVLPPSGRSGNLFSVTFSEPSSQSKAKVSLTTLCARHLCNPRRPASLLVLFFSSLKTRHLRVNILFVSSSSEFHFTFCVMYQMNFQISDHRQTPALFSMMS